MKKLYILVILILSLGSCDVLDVSPQNDILADDAFKTKAGIEKGILGAYTSFQNLSYYGRSYLIFSDLSADNLDHPDDATALEYTQIDNNAILPENGSVDGIWSSAYAGINIANNVIARVPGMADMTPEEKNIALGELYFIRALNHFNLINYFGDAPIKVEPTIGTNGVNVPREPVSKVYEQIIADLQFAETHLNETNIKVRASKFAATALLARVYLYQGNYALAKAKATEVIDADYELIDYAAVFSDESAESIFEIDFTELNRNRIAEYNFPKTLNGRREVAPSSSIIDAYEEDDIRRDATIAYAGALPYPIKYDDLSKGADNVIILRLAEMYLIRAEAEANLEGDIDAIQADINIIRTRAGLENTDADNYDHLLLAIEQERRVEFAFEGHRWFDLVRTDRAIETLPNLESVDQTLFPIPLSEITTNQNPGMRQNNGY
ncbi:RagB/SusD family nutrient uptake outer membrane protein [Pseudochryseolinea flava]|uniref:SusD/RagB family nutrient-binding outer membrane lipoprotein n=1 Tax=Pseudochryseolinea flava TaxID=2059302 RepID=A0A364XW50_9BACT|nr:RagB/SusD family nutrient uptake outer membrane protein [Pseudochryseolinea flava]RAV98173.1 SusD/RagB family nutrient-binding outer membrane lipoprotein [Pseudochryseolinea flava]